MRNTWPGSCLRAMQRLLDVLRRVVKLVLAGENRDFVPGASTSVQTASPYHRPRLITLCVAAFYILLFQFAFYSCVLFNSGDNSQPRLSRAEVLALAAFPGEGNLYGELSERLSVWQTLPQRLPILLTVVVVVAAALLLGDLQLRLIVPEVRVSQTERLLLVYGLGMAGVSLTTQLLGLAGQLSPQTFGTTIGVMGLFWLTVAKPWGWLGAKRSDSGRGRGQRRLRVPGWLEGLILLITVPFGLLALLAAALPTPDFDALAYHLLGPKEYWLEGQIRFLPHNVYTTFPFFTEMFHLLGMTLLGDWFRGGLAGQVMLWTFGPATALAVGSLGYRLFGPTAGWLAGMIYMTAPWAYRLSAIPYVEGALLFYGTLTLLTALSVGRGARWALLAGCFAGCATACKYPGLVMVAVPMGVVTVLVGRWRRAAAYSLAFATGCLLFVGPWLVRNALWTGNPVYPLAYSWFGGIDWSTEDAQHFDSHHRSNDFSIASLARYVGELPTGNNWGRVLGEIPCRSDWQSALLFTFAPLALLGRRRRRAAALWLLLAYLFLAFWTLTHRLDRFWLPLEPFAAVLAGAGMAWCTHRGWSGLVGCSVALAVFYNLAYCSTSLCGLNNYTADLDQQRLLTAATSPAVGVANYSGLVPHDATVLYLGYPAVYYAIAPARYNTVFDHNLLEQWVRRADANGLRAPEEIRQVLRREGIEYIIVDWSWIERYRSPGNYGYAPFIQPELFEALVQQKVLLAVPLTRLASSSALPVQLYRVLPPKDVP